MLRTTSKWIGLAILLTLFFASPTESYGQKKEKTNGPPPWAPAHGYRAQTRHIYFPDQNFYYDIQKSVYIYMSADRWQISVNLPALYAGVDLKIATKVELELDLDSPQKYNADHIVKYKGKAKGNMSKGRNNPPGKKKT